MRIILQSFSHNPTSFMRQCGYAFDRQTGDEMSFMRRVAGYDYPRFHAYINLETNTLAINLHLDQKQPSYGHGARAHGGDYDSEIVSAEADRIRQFFAQRAPYRP